MFDYVAERALSEKLHSIRIDTHQDNKPMLRALEKAGFSRCGTIRLIGGLENGQLRVAFEKIV